MGIILDIFIIAILALNIIMGYKKGLINVVFNIFAFLIAILISLILYKPVANFIINNTNIQENMKTMIMKNNKESEPKEENSTNDIQKYIENQMKNLNEEAKETATEILAQNVSTKLIEIMTVIILCILTRIVLIIFKFFAETLANLPIVKQCNELGGIIYGVVTGIIIIYIILTILFFVVSINENGTISNMIDSSFITKILYDNNIIVNYCLLGKNLL